MLYLLRAHSAHTAQTTATTGAAAKMPLRSGKRGDRARICPNNAPQPPSSGARLPSAASQAHTTPIRMNPACVKHRQAGAAARPGARGTAPTATGPSQHPHRTKNHVR